MQMCMFMQLRGVEDCSCTCSSCWRGAAPGPAAPAEGVVVSGTLESWLAFAQVRHKLEAAGLGAPALPHLVHALISDTAMQPNPAGFEVQEHVHVVLEAVAWCLLRHVGAERKVCERGRSHLMQVQQQRAPGGGGGVAPAAAHRRRSATFPSIIRNRCFRHAS